MNFWIAIPDSSLVDEQTKRDKSIKTAHIARSCAIFKVNRIYIYRDRERDYSYDRKMLKLILEFMDTPQYLRRILYPKIAELEFAGILHPLKAPHHKPSIDPKNIKVGDIRQAITAKVKGTYFVDAGLNALVPLEGSALEGKRITVKFTSEYPTLRCAVASQQDIHQYWGYEVKEVVSISEMLKGLNNMVVNFDTFLEFYKRTVIGDRDDSPFDLLSNGEFLFNILPRVRRHLLQTQRNSLRFLIEIKNLD